MRLRDDDHQMSESGGHQIEKALADFVGTITEGPKLMLMLCCKDGLAGTSVLERLSWQQRAVSHRHSKYSSSFVSSNNTCLQKE